jgi:hypothetical protein
LDFWFDGEEYKTKWVIYSLLYTFLSVTAKTLLEAGFLGLLTSSPEYLEPKPVPRPPF